jgi:hypothetical protein
VRAARSRVKSPRHNFMGSVTGPRRQELLEKVAMLCFLRARTGNNEQAIADKLGFGSPHAMYLELARLNVPQWIIRPDGQEAQHDETKKARRARRGRDEPEQLPPAARATELFKQELETLSKAADQLSARREHLKDERFVVEYVEQLDSSPFVSRPSVTFHGPTTRRTLLGASQFPTEPLTKLIACYALSEAPIDPLLHALHPDVSEEVKGDTEQYREKLRIAARRLATRVRGGILRTGRTTGVVSPEEMRIAVFVQEFAAQGASDPKIRELLGRINVSWTDIALPDIARLRSLNLPDSTG